MKSIFILYIKDHRFNPYGRTVGVYTDRPKLLKAIDALYNEYKIKYSIILRKPHIGAPPRLSDDHIWYEEWPVNGDPLWWGDPFVPREDREEDDFS